MVGWKGDTIHVFNKNEAAVHDSDYFQNLSHRVNVLLMGDSLGDLHMADGAEHMESKLTIGFLNTRVNRLSYISICSTSINSGTDKVGI